MNRSDFSKAHNDGQIQYTYFMAGVAGASIGYVLTKLDGQSPTYWLLPGALALLFWVISFFCGCMMITWGLRALRDEWFAAAIQDSLSKTTMFVDHDSIRVHAEITKAATRRNQVAATFRKVQIWSLYAGVVMFIVWRAIEMFRPHADTRPWCFVPGFSI